MRAPVLVRPVCGYMGWRKASPYDGPTGACLTGRECPERPSFKVASL